MVVGIASGCELAVSGRLDGHHAADLRDALHAAIDAGSGDLVVDVSGVELVDATGLGVLLGAHQRAGRSQRRLVLRDPAPRLARILRVTRLDRVLTMESRATV